MVVSPQKPEIPRYFSNGRDHGLDIAYLIQDKAEGLAAAVREALPWIGGRPGCLVLPDAVFRPADAVSKLRRMLEGDRADLVLGVFPVDTPHLLGPVNVGRDGEVIEVFEKPEHSRHFNTWGAAVWSHKFSEFFSQIVPEEEVGGSVGTVFNDAVRHGLKVKAVEFPDGSYLDVGTPDGLVNFLSSDWRAGL